MIPISGPSPEIDLSVRYHWTFMSCTKVLKYAAMEQELNELKRSVDATHKSKFNISPSLIDNPQVFDQKRSPSAPTAPSIPFSAIKQQPLLQAGWVDRRDIPATATTSSVVGQPAITTSQSTVAITRLGMDPQTVMNRPAFK